MIHANLLRPKTRTTTSTTTTSPPKPTPECPPHSSNAKTLTLPSKMSHRSKSLLKPALAWPSSSSSYPPTLSSKPSSPQTLTLTIPLSIPKDKIPSLTPPSSKSLHLQSAQKIHLRSDRELRDRQRGYQGTR
ncbi:hypothetical protein RHSIM_Rhsim13G0128600 [Rhododendron simsii]|uniref:Uncharacterized protein n=1 Tax=Rhododendron simsii TaxID=118357 RepID=A0A834G167_RHOSS|nr:hypothetical protein RHSIM_Rhsim13G0128600 [Rhododendron simsii]